MLASEKLCAIASGVDMSPAGAMSARIARALVVVQLGAFRARQARLGVELVGAAQSWPWASVCQFRRSATNTGVLVWPLCRIAKAEKQTSRSCWLPGTSGGRKLGRTGGIRRRWSAPARPWARRSAPWRRRVLLARRLAMLGILLRLMVLLRPAAPARPAPAPASATADSACRWRRRSSPGTRTAAPSGTGEAAAGAGAGRGSAWGLFFLAGSSRASLLPVSYVAAATAAGMVWIVDE